MVEDLRVFHHVGFFRFSHATGGEISRADCLRDVFDAHLNGDEPDASLNGSFPKKYGYEKKQPEKELNDFTHGLKPHSATAEKRQSMSVTRSGVIICGVI